MRILIHMNEQHLFKIIGFSGVSICVWHTTEANARKWFAAGRATGGQQLVDGAGRVIAEVEHAFTGAR